MKSIFLSAGHSLTDPGALGHGRKEADIALEFRRMVELYVRRQAGAKVAIDGDAKVENWPLAQAIAAARNYDIAVEFHCNAAANPSATGTEVLSAGSATALATKISAACAEALKIRNRGAKPEDSGQHSRLGFIRAGGLIVEILFITNASDLAAYDARKWLAARAVADVLIAHANR